MIAIYIGIYDMPEDYGRDFEAWKRDMFAMFLQKRLGFLWELEHVSWMVENELDLVTVTSEARPIGNRAWAYYIVVTDPASVVQFRLRFPDFRNVSDPVLGKIARILGHG